MIKAIYIIGTIILLFFSFYLLKPLFHLNKLPQTNYVNLNYESIDLKKVDLKNKKTFIFYIDPTCNYCENIKSILDTLKPGHYNRIVICSNIENINYKKYKAKFNLIESDLFLIDNSNSFIRDFNIGFKYSLPLVLQYNKNGKLIKN